MTLILFHDSYVYSYRMKDLIPIMIQFIESRQKPNGYVLLVAHNARTFDVPFLLEEFNRCSFDIPPNWLFLDTLTLARELTKLDGLSLSSALRLCVHTCIMQLLMASYYCQQVLSFL